MFTLLFLSSFILILSHNINTFFKNFKLLRKLKRKKRILTNEFLFVQLDAKRISSNLIKGVDCKILLEYTTKNKINMLCRHLLENIIEVILQKKNEFKGEIFDIRSNDERNECSKTFNQILVVENLAMRF